ncbi:helix-turn-helix domain-containing protein (plasmid) [Streptomyces chartreusis]|uniref:helix-turn-helix domain-containing protein n=1 Tax=Streptomyces chartreusis TaxID=1969 RepID=UPI00386DA8A6|nr:helix-turn-helix domain-containing protein [Streptomyces chartreusis]
MPSAHQWLHATTGRIATCAHSWMQAVHWIAGSGLYTPSRAHGPKWGATTIAIAQEIAALKECRPGIDYLARKLKVSVRTVKYHLGMLREAGLLVYRSKGTRIRGGGNQASVFERIIPIQFDTALGIRTVGEGVQRRPVGAAEESRTLLGKLAKKAARKARRRPRRKSSSAERRCTPMQVGTSGTFSADRTYSPPESKLASGKRESSHRKSVKRGPRKLNKIGRRYQLARELIQLVPWLRSASVPRIAWIIRHVADAGWTALEVQAIAEQERPIHAADVRRPSGLLADRLGNLHLLYTTPERRKTAVQAWQDSLAQEQARHAEAAQHADHTHGPASVTVQDLFREAARRVDEIADRQQHGTDEQPLFEIQVDTAPDVLALEELDREFIKQVRADAAKDLTSITIAIDSGLPETEARRLYTNWLVDQALAAQRRAELTPAF